MNELFVTWSNIKLTLTVTETHIFVHATLKGTNGTDKNCVAID